MEQRQERQAAAARLDALHEFAAHFAAPSSGVNRTLDAVAAQVLAAFRQACVEALLLKGRALATLLYRAGEQRDYSDVDLLVAPHDLDAAEATLRGLGYENASSAQGIDDIGGVVHADTWIRATPGSNDQAMIDLHRWLPGARAKPGKAWEALAARRTWIEIEGRQAAVLDRAGQAMHLATHAAQHGPGFPKPVDELALALERWPADIWDSAAGLAQEIDATEAFAAGLRLVPEGAVVAARLALASTAELDWTIRHRGGHAGRFTSRRSQTPAGHANAFRSCAAHSCRVGCGSCTSIHGPGRADCVSSRRMEPIWLGRPDGQPARGYSVGARGVRDGRAEARIISNTWTAHQDATGQLLQMQVVGWQSR